MILNFALTKVYYQKSIPNSIYTTYKCLYHGDSLEAESARNLEETEAAGESLALDERPDLIDGYERAGAATAGAAVHHHVVGRFLVLVLVFERSHALSDAREHADDRVDVVGHAVVGPLVQVKLSELVVVLCGCRAARCVAHDKLAYHTAAHHRRLAAQAHRLMLVHEVAATRRLGPIPVALELVALELVARAYHHAHIVQAQHAHKVKHRVLGRSLRRYVGVRVVHGVGHKAGVYVVAIVAHRCRCCLLGWRGAAQLHSVVVIYSFRFRQVNYTYTIYN